jgi:hypothetical protein
VVARSTVDVELEAKHLKLPAWIVQAVNAKAESERRSFTQQLTVDLETLYESARTKKPSKGRTR